MKGAALRSETFLASTLYAGRNPQPIRAKQCLLIILRSRVAKRRTAMKRAAIFFATLSCAAYALQPRSAAISWYVRPVSFMTGRGRLPMIWRNLCL